MAAGRGGRYRIDGKGVSLLSMLEPYVVDGKAYDLAHLNGFTQKVSFRLRRGEKSAPIEVRYSCHCWSRLPLEGEDIPGELLVPDGSVHMPRNRIFSPYRHELSLALPKMVSTLLTEHATVHYTKYENVVRLEKAIPVVAGPEAEDYYIFIKLEKREPDGAQKYIRMFVESAYPDNVMYDKPSYGKPVAFAELLGDCWEKRYPAEHRRK